MPCAECLRQLMESFLQVRMEKELAPLLAATEAVKKRLGVDARVPSYGTLKEWAQAQADVLVAAARGAKRGNGTLEPARVEIDLSGACGDLWPGRCNTSHCCKECISSCCTHVSYPVAEPGTAGHALRSSSAEAVSCRL